MKLIDKCWSCGEDVVTEVEDIEDNDYQEVLCPICAQRLGKETRYETS